MKTLIKTSHLVLLAAAAAQTCAFGSDPPAEGYVAHEWGTFTSVQGADGAPQAWHPLITSELPSFVYDRSGGTGAGKDIPAFHGFGKENYIALQRMETPVIYFYSGCERTVSARVLFPCGQITEWYPAATGPATDAAGGPGLLRKGELRWDNVRVLASSAEATPVALANDQRGSHYYAARATDANLVRIAPAENCSTREETEKFLFYRGVGWFTTPLRVSMTGDETSLELSNQGAEPLAHLFVVEMSKGKGRYTYLSQLGSKQTERVLLESAMGDPAQVTARLGAALREALTNEGLYPREAAAMVATWNEAWFGEEGLRVLYVLPRAWTDRILPLELTPAPKELVRIMVGRAEVLKPSVERQLAEQIRRYGDPDRATRQQAIADARALGLGRFLEPAVRRAQQRSESREYQEWAGQLLEAAGKPVKASAQVGAGATRDVVAAAK
jgi:hypothetical protein